MPNGTPHGVDRELRADLLPPPQPTPALTGSAGRASEPPPVIPDYELLRRIGRGAYGEVWLARNLTGSFVAVKVVRRSAFDHDRPFEREFEGIKRFEPISRSDPSQVSILHVGRGEGFFYYVMELADESSPERAVRSPDSDRQTTEAHHSTTPPLHHSNSSTPHSAFRTPHSYTPHTLREDLKQHGRLPVDQCVQIGLALTRALAHLHKCGLVHRDVKPSNVIFVGGVPKLADIGLVTSVDATRSLVGTEGYVAPEGPGTPQADLYSLGKLLYELSTGCDRKEFPALPPDIATRPDRNGLLELNAIVTRACQFDPRERHQSPNEMSADLALVKRGKSIRRQNLRRHRVKRAKQLTFALLVASTIGTASWLLIASFHSSASFTSKSIAVLPFDNDSPDKADEYLGASMADEISSGLTKIPGLGVLGRDSAVALKKAKDLPASARSLKLRAVLEGLVRKSGDKLYVTAQLIDPRNGYQLWSESHDRTISEIFGIETDITEKVAENLNVKLTDTVQTRLAIKPTKNLEAYQLYLEGRYSGRDGAGESDIKLAVERFQAALRLDPNFPAAYAGLAHCYIDLTRESVSGGELFSKALQHATKAVELDDRLAEAHTALARIKCHYEYDWVGAGKEFHKALDLDPSSAITHRFYASFLAGMGQFDDAIVHVRLAKKLDPWSASARYLLAWILFDARKYGPAVKEFQELLGLYENNARALDGLGWCYFAEGMYSDAIASWEKAGSIEGLSAEKNAALTRAYYEAGMKGYWEEHLKQAKEGDDPSNRSPFWIACDYAMLGQKDEAFKLLEEAYEKRTCSIAGVGTEYRLYGLHSDPRFAALLEKMKLKMPK